MYRDSRRHKIDPSVAEYISSMESDVRIFSPVIQINLAHVLMLAECGIISEEDAAALLHALGDLHEKGINALDLRPEFEDIHMAVEKFVTEATGKEIGGKLRTAKSRNDQVATAIRMTLRKELLGVQEKLLGLITGLVTLAKKNLDTVMPGYTHFQIAQPTTFAHHLAAYAWAFVRDLKRLEQAFENVDSCPMGACALAGTSFPIDRLRVARLLGFERVDENTMDAVGSRDFALQAIAALAILMANLSRLAEELVIWSSAEFDVIEIPEGFSATSSIMPQKKNPVVAELARAKTGRVFGDLLGALSMVKALPQSYNLDLQDLTPLLWDSIDETENSISIMAKLIVRIKTKRETMRRRVEESFATATELADTLVRKAGLSFKDAHAVVNRAIVRSMGERKKKKELGIDVLQAAAHDLLGRKIRIAQTELKKALDVREYVETKVLRGGPATAAVREQLESLERITKNHLKSVQTLKLRIAKAETELMEEVKRRLH